MNEAVNNAGSTYGGCDGKGSHATNRRVVSGVKYFILIKNNQYKVEKSGNKVREV